MKNILVTGGTGYIGSHTLVDLIENGYNPICIDNQSNSDIKVLDAVNEITGKEVQNFSIDLRNESELNQIFESTNIYGVIHFAAYKSVNESVSEPLKYYDNNIGGLITLLKVLRSYKVNNFIFSSSCSVYGNTKDLPVTEDTIFAEAECPYARTKQIGENILADYCSANKNFNCVLLRYFNPAGAHDSALIGESPINTATNLVPVITETAFGKRDAMTVFGTDYDTRDGSCIRDYIHVMDLAHAHTKAIAFLTENTSEKNIEVFNLGIGNGVTVLEAIHAFEKVSNQKLNYILGDRRAGDVVAIYADTEKASKILGWKPTRNIDDIMKTAWDWEVARS